MRVEQMNEMKLETNWFLKKIAAYNAQPDFGIDEHMVKLFYEATQKIADCVDQSNIVNDANHNQNDDVLFVIDESCYRYNRSITCTICNVSNFIFIEYAFIDCFQWNSFGLLATGQH